jgi:hypothetical protein
LRIVLVLVHRVDRLHHDRDAGKLAVHVGAGQKLLAPLHAALLELDGLGAQHQVREVQVPGCGGVYGHLVM